MKHIVDKNVRDYLIDFILKYLRLTEEEKQVLKNIVNEKKLAELEKIRKEKERKRFAKNLKIPNLKAEVRKFLRSILK